MKMLAADESLSEGTRESAQKALDDLVSTQIEAHSKQRLMEANMLLQAPQGLSDEMVDWLDQHRLQKCAADLARVAGDRVLPGDLQYLTDENVEDIGSGLTHVEKMRLQAALQSLDEDQSVGASEE